jgi:hypothetical protein
MDRRTFFGSTFVAAVTAKLGAFNDAPYRTVDTEVVDNIAGHDLVVERYRDRGFDVIRCRVNVEGKEYGIEEMIMDQEMAMFAAPEDAEEVAIKRMVVLLRRVVGEDAQRRV